MAELYINMGFSENPFSRFSAEEEREYLDKIFVQPKYYSTIHNDIKSGASRFIFGERGVGKSALVINLMKDFDNENIFSVLIDDYENTPINNNAKEFLSLTLSKLTTNFGLFLLRNKNCLNKLSKVEKEKLTLLINTFFETLSRSQFDDLYNKATNIKSINFVKRIINFFLLKPANIIASGCSEFIGSTISRALGLPDTLNESVYKEFFPELKSTDYLSRISPNLVEYPTLKVMLKELSRLIKKCGFIGVVVIYDKIDEYRLLGTQVSKIAEFIKDLSLDTALLLDADLSLVFSFWSKLRQPLTDFGVRCDKLKPIDISWTDEEVKNIMNDRLSYFSNKKIPSLEKIVPVKYVSPILELSNKSPRHLIILLSKIYDEQATLNESSNIFSVESIKRGLANYVQTFDFGTFYAGSNPATLRKTIREILKVHKTEFETKDLIDAFKISSQAANSKIRIMLDYSLIQDITSGTRAKKYKIIEPRVAYMITNDLKY